MEDIFSDETILLVKKAFPGAVQGNDWNTYSYVVAKLAGKWYVTGKDETGVGRTWEGLLQWLGRGMLMSVKLATDFSNVLVLGS